LTSLISAIRLLRLLQADVAGVSSQIAFRAEGRTAILGRYGDTWLQRYYEGAATSCRPSHRTSFPSFGGTSDALVVFAPWRTSAPPRPGVGHPVSPAGTLPRRRQDLPRSWGISIVRLHVFSPTPAGLLTPDHYGTATWPMDPYIQGPPQCIFRHSIVRLSDSLSTLRKADYSDPTQDPLPVAGQALPDGLSTHKIPVKGLKIVS
jgi:hypothetical protein